MTPPSLFQRRDLTAGEFLGDWMACKVKLRNHNTRITSALVAAMENRESALLYHSAFLAAVYLDPRYQCVLNTQQRRIAKQHLARLWRALPTASPGPKSEGHIMDELTETGGTFGTENEDILEKLLCERDQGESCTAKKSKESWYGIVESIDSFDNTVRLEKRANVLTWWSLHPNKYLKSLAEVALALPVTQASVERTFSGLRYIMDELRLWMKDDVIDAIMLLRCNT